MGPSTILWGFRFRSPSRVWRGRGSKFILEILNTAVTQKSLIGPHSVRVPSKKALASATCLLGTHSGVISNAWCIVVMPELERAPKTPHSRQGSHLLLKTALCCNWATRDPEGVIFDAPNQGDRLPNDSCALKKKYGLHPDRVIYCLGKR